MCKRLVALLSALVLAFGVSAVASAPASAEGVWNRAESTSTP